MNLELRQKVLLFQITTAIGLVFGLVGFTYNVWRMEITEANNNTRMACFEILKELGELEQLIYSAHYDRHDEAGSPRRGWVKIGLVSDLSVLATPRVEEEAAHLKDTWSEHWNKYGENRESVDQIVAAIDSVRGQIKSALGDLR